MRKSGQKPIYETMDAEAFHAYLHTLPRKQLYEVRGEIAASISRIDDQLTDPARGNTDDWAHRAKSARRCSVARLYAIRDYLSEMDRAERVATAKASREVDLDEGRLFIRAARKLLPNDLYMRLWEEAETLKEAACA